MTLKDRLKEGWMHCALIIEVAGKPKEYIEQVLAEVVEAIGRINGVELIDKKFHEPKEGKSLFSTFSEVEVAVKDIKTLADIVFAYMPSNIEILAPNEMKMSLNDTNTLINILAGKLHGYDSLAKKLKLENMIFKKKLHELGALPELNKPAQNELDSIKAESASEEKKSSKSE